MTGAGDTRAPERVAEAARAEGLTLAGCPTSCCDDDCDAPCHEVHLLPSHRWHEPGWSCAEVQLAIARAVAAERDRLLLAVRHTCACRPCKDAIASLIRGETRTVPSDDFGEPVL